MSVSVVIPVHNGAKYLAEAIESAYAQTRSPDEVIVVDDGSTDRTAELVREFANRPGFCAVRKVQGGEASARNAGVTRARGEYVAFLDHDDVWHPAKLERQLSEFESGWGMSFTAHTVTSPDESRVERYESWDAEAAAVRRLLEHSPPLWPSSAALVRRDLLQRIGPFQQIKPFGDDWLMWLRIVAAGNGVGYTGEPLTQYRWHGDNLSKDDAGFYEAACGVFDAYGDSRLRTEWRLRAASAARARQDLTLARRRVVQAARIRPWAIRPGWVRLMMG